MRLLQRRLLKTNSMNIKNYKNEDYESLVSLYKDSSLSGGQFDENRDSREKLESKIKDDTEAIIVCESEGNIIGTVSLIEDGRVAWLFRFAVANADEEVTKLLFEKASEILKKRGHNQVLVYSPTGNTSLDSRYAEVLGFEKGSDYTCFWKNI